jgi:hypothetical protein
MWEAALYTFLGGPCVGSGHEALLERKAWRSTCIVAVMSWRGQKRISSCYERHFTELDHPLCGLSHRLTSIVLAP